MVRLFNVKLDVFEEALVAYLKVLSQAEFCLRGLLFDLEN
jgi:hypothetical protein